MRRVTIMIGPSGSGKSTWIQRNLQGAEVCSADHFFYIDGVYCFDASKLSLAHAACLRKFTERLRVILYPVKNPYDERHVDLVVDNTNLSIAELAPYIALARAYGIEPEVVVLRGMYANVHGVPDHVVERHRAALDSLCEKWPSYWPARRNVDGQEWPLTYSREHW